MDRFIKTIFLALLYTLIQSHAYAASSLMPSLIHYKASYNGLPIEVSRELKRLDDCNFSIHSYAENFLGHISENGQFRLDKNQQIKNEKYAYERNLLGKKTTEALNFDYAKDIARYQSGETERQVVLDKPYHSRISYQIQLQEDISQNKKQFNYPVIVRGRPKIYTFEKVGEEVLKIPLGDIKTIKVRRVREDSDRETAFWFAPELNYLLVKLWQREKGEDFQITLDSGNIDGMELSEYLKRRDD